MRTPPSPVYLPSPPVVARLLAKVAALAVAQGAAAGTLPPLWEVLPAAQLLVPSTVLRGQVTGATPPAQPRLPPQAERTPQAAMPNALAAEPRPALEQPATTPPRFPAPLFTEAAPEAAEVTPRPNPVAPTNRWPPSPQPVPATRPEVPTTAPVAAQPLPQTGATQAAPPVAVAAPNAGQDRTAAVRAAPNPPPLSVGERPPVSAQVLPGNDLSQASTPASLKMANSLAWSNRLDDAIVAYEALMRDPNQASATRVPLANAYRWTGRPDLALPLYQQAGREAPTDTAIAEGLEYVERDLRPRTTLDLGTNADSGDLANHMATLRHAWRDASLKQVFEIETNWRNSLQGPNGPTARSNAFNLRYAHTGLAWQPEIELGAQAEPRQLWLGGVRLKLPQLPVHVGVARENFGVTSFSARALAAGLTANRLSVDGSWGGEPGVLTARADWYRISDGNQLRTTSLKATPSWRPLGLWFKPYVSLDTRDVRFTSPAYWSPAEGSGSLGVGAIAEWSEKDWFFYMAGQLGARVYGEAGNSWSASVGGQRWLTRDLALTVNLWGMSSQRNQARYKAHSLGIKLDRLW